MPDYRPSSLSEPRDVVSSPFCFDIVTSAYVWCRQIVIYTITMEERGYVYPCYWEHKFNLFELCVFESNYYWIKSRASLTECNPVTTPCAVGQVWSAKACPKEQTSAEECKKYSGLVALANFIACWTRPDIAFTVNKLMLCVVCPGWCRLRALRANTTNSRAPE